MTRRQFASFAAVAIIAIVAVFAASRTIGSSQPAITGELVETFCYAKVRIGGVAHAACGIECAKRGIPLAVVDAQSRTAYVLLPGRDKSSVPPELIAQMGHKVTIRGEIITRGGNNFITVQSWKRAS
ncbi:MAG TPA: hypothetical protein VGQ36_27765 [Thermoanaerobaculia bacterium]|jgi:hypothetical protein|nr:hypothetical protein [Thermoanaerobaculia bacterium]